LSDLEKSDKEYDFYTDPVQVCVGHVLTPHHVHSEYGGTMKEKIPLMKYGEAQSVSVPEDMGCLCFCAPVKLDA